MFFDIYECLRVSNIFNAIFMSMLYLSLLVLFGTNGLYMSILFTRL